MENAFELYSKNPNIHKSFPLFVLDVNQDKCYPKRQRFHEMHWHDEIQLTYVLEGNITIRTLNASYTISKNQAVFINKQVLHIITDSQNAHYRTYLFPESLILFQVDYLNQKIQTFLSNTNVTLYPIFQDKLIQIIKEMDSIYQQRDNEYQICSYLALIISKLSDLIPPSNKTIEYHQNIYIQQCLAYIHTHYQEEITLKNLADYCQISQGYLGRLFKMILNTTPYDYLIQYRLQQSLKLLISKQNNITEIAMNVGFNSVSHFIQCFKKQMSMTPKQYQKELH